MTPSLGEFYAEQYLTYGEAIRAGAVAFALIGAAQTETTSCTNTDVPTNCKNISTNGIALLSIGAIAYVGGVLYDVFDAARRGRSLQLQAAHIFHTDLEFVPKRRVHFGRSLKGEQVTVLQIVGDRSEDTIDFVAFRRFVHVAAGGFR